MKEIIVENLIRKHLTENGWTVAPRKRQGIDIEATKENRTAVIEAKGIGAHSTAMTNNFYSVLGQILKDMTYQYSAQHQFGNM